MTRLLVEADGGSRGNPGPAGYGAVVRDGDSGTLLAEVGAFIGKATNNVAEYRGLIAGLRRAAELVPSATVEARLDSKLVVEQMAGRWRIKHPDLVPLAQEAQDVAATLATVTYTWVPRERNAHADRLANKAMDGTSVDNTPTQPDSASKTRTDSPAGWGAPTAQATRVQLLRHGQTHLSVERRFAGRGDIALTDVGQDQAHRTAARLVDSGIEAVVSSPLHRSRATAAPVAAALGVPVDIHEGLTETDFGDWEGLTFGEVRERSPEELNRWLADAAQAPPGGESFATVTQRVARARDDLLQTYSAKSLLIVSHVTPIKALLRLALGAPPEAMYRMHLDVACLSEIIYYLDGPAMVRSMNNTAHLGVD